MTEPRVIRHVHWCEFFLVARQGNVTRPGEPVMLRLDRVEAFRATSSNTTVATMCSGQEHEFYISYEEFKKCLNYTTKETP